MPSNLSKSPLNPAVSIAALASEFRCAQPFPHIVIDEFLNTEVADAIAAEFPAYNESIWNEYNNAIEVKKSCNFWDRFPPATYRLFSYLNSDDFVSEMSQLMGETLYSDPGLHGGGWHSHGAGGKLNMHLDYSIHPKSGMERRLNLIIYIQPGWKTEWGGSLGFWAHDEEKKAPGALVRDIPCLFNRAVIFDTSRNSWHGLPEPVTCPVDKPRNSLAVYYMSAPREGTPERGRARYAPYREQANDPEVLELIRLRAQVQTSAAVYRQPKKEK
jgi:Rps23 Pro-64 3,4-dihydroxylase Tpa1-like proline 4-hydroxylase